MDTTHPTFRIARTQRFETKIIETGVWECQIDPNAPDVETYVTVECPIDYDSDGSIEPEEILNDPRVRVVRDPDARTVAAAVDVLGWQSELSVLAVGNGIARVRTSSGLERAVPVAMFAGLLELAAQVHGFGLEGVLQPAPRPQHPPVLRLVQ